MTQHLFLQSFCQLCLYLIKNNCYKWRFGAPRVNTEHKYQQEIETWHWADALMAYRVIVLFKQFNTSPCVRLYKYPVVKARNLWTSNEADTVNSRLTDTSLLRILYY